jgi:broad specificity phosphatase PhoE
VVRLVLIRHARTPSNVGGLLDTRVPGPGLTEEGAHQASNLARVLESRSIDPSTFGALYVSTMVRTQLTAAPLAALTGLVPRVRDGLREISAGGLGMRSDEAAKTEYLSLVEHWAAGDVQRRLPGGESGHEFFERFDAVVSEAVKEAASCHAAAVAVISHGAAIRCWAAGRSTTVTPGFAASHLLANLDTVVLESIGDSTGGVAWRISSWADVPL